MTGIELGKAGLQAAVDHAESKIDRFSEMIKSRFRNYIAEKGKGYVFRVEQFRNWCEEKGTPDPPSKRAYGFISTWAQKENMVELAGYSRVTNPKAHGCPIREWKII